MKPGRLQNALKSLGRTSKYIKMLRPDFKIHQNASAGLQNPLKCSGRRLGRSPEASRDTPGLPGNCRIPKNPKNVMLGVTRSSRIRSLGWNDPISTHPTKKSNFFVLKFPRPVGIFESDLFWKRGSKLFSGQPSRNNEK